MKKEGKNIFFHIFFILLKTNTNYAHMQNFFQIPQKMKTGVQNVTKSVKDTLPFWPETNIKYFLSRTLDNCTPEEEALPTYMSGGRQAAMSHHYFPFQATY